MTDYLNTNQMIKLERHAFENYPITLEQMMRNAGRAVFDVVMNEVVPVITTQSSEGETTASRLQDVKILVVSGKGNNGGDALVTARLLKERGIDVAILTPNPLVADADLRPLQQLHSDVVEISDSFSLIIDALFGFSLKGNPRPPANLLIEQINCSGVPVLSVDVPSGLDVHDGSAKRPCVKADYTVALGMLKKGFKEYPGLIGKVYLGDLGIPEEAYRELGYEPPIFRGKSYCSVN